MFRFALAVVMAIVTVPADAQSATAGETHFEATMLVTGSLDIESDGTVSAHVIDHREKVPAYVIDVITRAAGGWRFEPVLKDGVAVPARARMTVRLLATPIEGGDFRMAIRSATFGARYPEGTDHVGRVRIRPPAYPGFALERGATGTAYMMLKIDRMGRVADAVAEQVNLRGTADAETMAILRSRFAEAALAVMHRWKFAPPTTGEHADDPFWSVRMPVTFTIGNEATEETAYGRWISYVPGPYQPAPWVREEERIANDAIAGGTLQQAGTGYRLLTPLQPES